MAENPSALGHIIEGVVERDPLTDRVQIMSIGPSGSAEVVDLQELAAQYEGQEVRLTLASFENLSKLAQLVEEQGGGQISGIMPQDLPEVPFDVRRS